MTDITIPPAALEAGAEVFLECDRSPACSFEDALRAAFLAMLRAWEGMRISWLASNDGAIVLPLPQEASDD
jgi:hypothetical protein